ncbi:MAG TPA: hypothetical protein VFI47_14140 [Acidimicrobiales bacterium]|nr:hypothetical protein [Acidimicrobiales bacterium]
MAAALVDALGVPHAVPTRQAVAGLLVALALLTALTGARTRVVWFKVSPVLLTSTASRPARARSDSTEGLVAVAYELHETPGKTRNARRRVARDTTTVELLTAWRHKQHAERAAIGAPPPDRVFTTSTGEAIHPHLLSKRSNDSCAGPTCP